MQADVERLLARLLTDRQLRDRFVADSRGVAMAEGLSREETEMVAQMPARDLHTAARSYEHKRRAKGEPTGRAWFARLPWARRR